MASNPDIQLGRANGTSTCRRPLMSAGGGINLRVTLPSHEDQVGRIGRGNRPRSMELWRRSIYDDRRRWDRWGRSERVREWRDARRRVRHATSPVRQGRRVLHRDARVRLHYAEMESLRHLLLAVRELQLRPEDMQWRPGLRPALRRRARGRGSQHDLRVRADASRVHSSVDMRLRDHQPSRGLHAATLRRMHRKRVSRDVVVHGRLMLLPY